MNQIRQIRQIPQIPETPQTPQTDFEISDFSLYNYNRKIWICNTPPPLIFPRNPADFLMNFLMNLLMNFLMNLLMNFC